MRKNKYRPTPEELAKRDEKRARVRELAKRVSAMDGATRESLARKAGIRNLDGHELSLKNQCLLILQRPNVSLVCGFRQWKKAGRSVAKGEQSLCIFVPVFDEKTPGAEKYEEGGSVDFFVTGNVFDVSQTRELSAQGRADEETLLNAPLDQPLNDAELGALDRLTARELALAEAGA